MSSDKQNCSTFEPSSFHPDHLADLRRPGLSDEMIATAGIKSVPPMDICRSLKFSPQYLNNAYEIPYPGTDFSRFRCFYEGKGNGRRKYLQPRNTTLHLYFPPGVNGNLADTTIPLYITEGEKKALKGAQESLCCIGLGGLWSWKTGGKPLPEFDQIAFEGRDVAIIPDNDFQRRLDGYENRDLVSALCGLVKALTKRGAKIKVILLPESGEKMGLDDFLVNHPVEAIGELHSVEGAEFLAEQEEFGKQVKKGPTQAKVLVDLATFAQLFHTSNGDCYAVIHMADHMETWPVRSRAFKRWLSSLFYAKESKPAGSQALADAMSVIEGKAQFDGAEEKTFVRLAGKDGRIYLDLADPLWRCIEISTTGWQVISNPPVKFLRPKGALPLPVPEQGGSLEDLRPFLNSGTSNTDESFRLIVAWLLQAINPEGPCPILILEGEQGSAKSTTAKVLRNTIDANLAPIRSAPRDDRDLIIAATNGLVVAFDNLSGVPNWLSDAMCRLATGGGIGTRELYTNGDEFIFEATRPMILNGIDQIASRHDLADRSIILNLPSIPEDKRVHERQFWDSFNEAHPRILGALLDAVSCALSNIESTKLERLPRMADFAMWVSAGELALPWKVGDFLEAYNTHRMEAVTECLDSDLVACAIQSMMGVLKEWSGTATALLDVLRGRVADETAKSKSWPKDPTRLSMRIRRNVTFLRLVGIQVEMKKSGDRNITIRKGN